MPDKKLSIRQGGIIYYKNIMGKENIEWQRFKVLLDYYHIDIDKPLNKMTKKEMDLMMYGSQDLIEYEIAANPVILLNVQNLSKVYVR